jgi:hypothetical protein
MTESGTGKNPLITTDAQGKARGVPTKKLVSDQRLEENPDVDVRLSERLGGRLVRVSGHAGPP